MSNDMDRLRIMAGSQLRVAEALQMTPEQISRIATGKSRMPGYVTAIVELLEALPPKDWPERWRPHENPRK